MRNAWVFVCMYEEHMGFCVYVWGKHGPLCVCWGTHGFCLYVWGTHGSCQQITWEFNKKEKQKFKCEIWCFVLLTTNRHTSFEKNTRTSSVQPILSTGICTYAYVSHGHTTHKCVRMCVFVLELQNNWDWANVFQRFSSSKLYKNQLKTVGPVPIIL
jgi:hypothetical protein